MSSILNAINISGVSDVAHCVAWFSVKPNGHKVSGLKSVAKAPVDMKLF